MSTELPPTELPPPITAEDLVRWYELSEQLSKLKSAEAMLRARIFNFYFKEPKEGTNTVPLNDGTGAVVKGTHVLNRAVDVGTLDALRATQAVEGYNGPKLELDKLVKYKPEVSISEYRKLTDEERTLFDSALIIKPGSPQLEITIPKRATPGA